MKHEILYRPAYSLLRVELPPGEAIQGEAGAMVSMSGGVTLETAAKGGMFGALKRSVLAGESFFVNTFRASNGPGEVTFAPSYPGDIAPLELRNQTVYAQSGAYIAGAPEIEVDTKWGGARTFFSGEGLFLLKLHGSGPLFLSSYGAIHPMELGPGQKWRVDTGHMVAFTEGTGYNVQKVGGLKSTLLSGEGLVVELTGPGKVWIQTRQPGAFAQWIAPFLPRKS